MSGEPGCLSCCLATIVWLALFGLVFVAVVVGVAVGVVFFL